MAQLRAILVAPTIDRAKLESLRVGQLRTRNLISKRLADAVADAADVLTPAQRSQLVEVMDRHGRHRS